MRLLRSFFSIKSLLIVYSIAVFVFIAFIKQPNRYGDGFEYIYMAESFIQHKTPELLDSDVLVAQAKLKEQNPHVYFPENVKSGYYKNNDKKWYCYHFWLYSLFVAPIQQVVHFFKGNELRAFGITNVLLYLLMLWVVFLNTSKEKRGLLTALMALSPLVPYVTWTHTEVFSASLLTIALVFYLKKNFPLAILYSALASCQNPPIGFFTVWCGLVYLYQTIMKYKTEKKFDLRHFIITGLCGIPLLLAPLFYWINFSTFNLIAKVGAARPELISFSKFFSYFFDLNQGAILYSGALLFLFIGCAIINIFKRDFKYFEFVIVTLLMAGLSLSAPSWNCGMSGVIRYFVWVYPLLVFYVVYAANFKKIMTGLLIVNALFLVVIHDGFKGTEFFIYHNTLAKYVLSHFPYLYNPEYQIFIARTLHKGLIGTVSWPIVYLDEEGHVKKILTNKEGWEKLLQNDQYEVLDKQFYQERLSDFSNDEYQLRYINVLNNEIVQFATTLKLKDKINFNEIDTEIEGLSGKEDWGRWTDGSVAHFRLLIEDYDPQKGDVTLKFNGHPFMYLSHQNVNVDVYSQSQFLATWHFDQEQNVLNHTLKIPQSLISSSGGIDLKFYIDNPKSPKELGANADSRKLGIGFVSIEILKERQEK